MMSSTRLIGQLTGALLWDYFGSLRTVYGFASIAGMFLVVGLAYALKSLKLEYKGESTIIAKTE
jgi:hypothetical protein